MGFKILSKEKREQEEADRLQAIDEEISDRITDRNNKLRQLVQTQKRNKLIFLVSLISIVVISLFFGIYNTFLKHQLTADEALVRVIQYQNFNFFNATGLDGYIRENVDKILPSVLVLDKESNLTGYEVLKETTALNKYYTYNNNYANAYFSVDVKIQPKAEKVDDAIIEKDPIIKRYSFLLPIYYDNQRYAYSLAGEPMLLAMTDIENDVQVYSNPLYSFDPAVIGKEIAPMQPADADSAKTFMNNFLIMYFNQPDTTVDSMIPESINFNSEYRNIYSFNSIKTFEIYEENNAKGYNSKIQYYLTDESGLTLLVTNYMVLEKDGNSWKITNISY